MAERPNARLLKSLGRESRGFESHSLRSLAPTPIAVSFEGPPLPALEVGVALLEECGEALDEVLALEQREQLEIDVVHVVVERLPLGQAEHALGGPHRERRI